MVYELQFQPDQGKGGGQGGGPNKKGRGGGGEGGGVSMKHAMHVLRYMSVFALRPCMCSLKRQQRRREDKGTYRRHAREPPERDRGRTNPKGGQRATPGNCGRTGRRPRNCRAGGAESPSTVGESSEGRPPPEAGRRTEEGGGHGTRRGRGRGRERGKGKRGRREKGREQKGGRDRERKKGRTGRKGGEGGRGRRTAGRRIRSRCPFSTGGIL